MTFHALKQLLEKYNIPDDAKLMSDSGWECDATNMDGVYYNSKKNIIVFTQNISEYDDYFNDPDWKTLVTEA